jgi:hypothetical protein
MPKSKKNIKVRDLKPNKDAKGGRHAVNAPGMNRPGTNAPGVNRPGVNRPGVN